MVYSRARPPSAVRYEGPVKGIESEAVRSDCKAVCESLPSIILFVDLLLSLPEVENDLHRSLKDVHTALHALQYKVSEDPLLEIHALLRQFQIRIHTVVNGTSNDPTRMIQTANKAYRQFIEDVGCMTPRFRPWSRSESGSHDHFPEYPEKLQLREVEEEKLQSKVVYLDEIANRLGE
jgi:hypothetical protein